MASLSSLLSLSSPYSRSKNQPSAPRNRRHETNYCVPCRASNNNGDQTPINSKPRVFDRRDVLFGLGGLYGAATISGGDMPALADSHTISPDTDHCGPARTPAGPKNCCPSKIQGIIDFIPPVIPIPRVRPAAHLITPDQLAKFEKAIHLMKLLPKDDPRYFYNQAKVHCAYCNYAYKQLDSIPQTELQVHWNALFFPFHRCYLYFFERICGHLIGDPSFAIPFWNWDSIPGMYMPKIYNNPQSPLYDKLRDARHVPPKLLYLNYDDDEDPPFDVVDCNLRWMNKQMKVAGKSARGFLGQLLKRGDVAKSDGMGSIESSPHNNLHDWVGDPNSPHHEDMGTFYSAGNDPLFYGHHANVDRMWSIWQKLETVPRDYTDPDWLGSSFVFYDEHKNAVRIKVGDCVDSLNLGYVYQDVEIPWLDTKQIPRQKPPPSASSSEPPPPPEVRFPQVLNSEINLVVARESRSRSIEQKGEEDEVLVIEDIEFDRTSRVHFNVLVNVLDEGADVCPGNIEFAGSFRNIPHGHAHNSAKDSLRFVITELVEELGLDDADSLYVKIVPKVGGDKVTIGGIKIELQPI